MTKKLHLLFLLFPVLFYAQVTNEGKPVSWDLDNSDIEKLELPSFDLQKLIEEDIENDKKKDIPWRFGYEHQVDIGLETHGSWQNMEDGSRYWLVNIYSSGAKTMNFIFDEFFIPKGGKLYFYNSDRSDLLGAYTHSQNREDKVFGSWLVNGQDIFVEYFEPADKIGEGKLHIEKAVHGYRSITDFHNNQKNLNSSGACNLDVDCSIGTDFDTVKDELKKSVGLVNLGSGVCTGSLVNNTNNDGTPYFLTANHCLGSNPGIWSFRFNWRSPNPVCASFTGSTNGPFNQTASGAVLRASNGSSDFALAEITANIPSSWDLVWSGWDRSFNTPNFTVGIHHPSGDIMKVCRDDDSPFATSIFFNGSTNNVWYINEWEIGVTEPGSSGSPLYNQDGKIIGILSGGLAACAGNVNNNQYDFYGRFNEAWDSGFSSSTRLRDWLDPTNSGVTTLDPFPNNLSTDGFNQLSETDIKIYPNPADEFVIIESTIENNMKIDLFDISGKLILSSVGKKMNVSAVSKGIYLIKITAGQQNHSITKKIIIK
jgi:hypothetical protein